MFALIWNDPDRILFILLGILIVDNLWSIYLMLREILIVHRVTEVPDLLRPYLSRELFDSMRTYKLHKSWLFIGNTLFMVVFCGCLELYFGFYAFVWNLANMMAFAKWMQHELVISIIFACILNVYLVIKSVPGRFYEKYCITSLVKRHPQKWYVYILGFLLDTILSFALLVIMVVLFIYIVKYLGQYAFLGLYALAMLLTVFIILMLPYFIDPFVGKRVPLQNESLKAELERLTARVGFPMQQVHIIRVRDPSTGSNAFFYGSCCLKRIVIFDTLLYNRGLQNHVQLPAEEMGKGLRDPQVVAVVAHELGHWKYGHFYKAIIMFKTHLLLTLFLFSLFFPHGPLYQAVGFECGLQPTIVGFLIVFGYVLAPYFTLSNVLMLSVTRQFEYQADKFASQLGHAGNLRLALLKLYADNLSFPISDECYSIWHHTHPTMLHRLARLDEHEANRN
ncbi:CAAX prenyl protease 1 homolog [Drosophila innubila]|uniref:CAAX prenyl protease 1 homolog n=1 Tax=Drosophila innubila TaxID=198719 RepID=UPI00148D6032|nr:CAAX prenyl protease 1 homolog [Drosophila innubila]